MSKDTVISVKDMVARKPHTCEQCGKVIPIGEKYRRLTGTYYDGELYSFAEHLDCLAVWEVVVYHNAAIDDELPSLREALEYLCDEDKEAEEEWIREEYPKVAERLFGKKEEAA